MHRLRTLARLPLVLLLRADVAGLRAASAALVWLRDEFGLSRRLVLRLLLFVQAGVSMLQHKWLGLGFEILILAYQELVPERAGRDVDLAYLRVGFGLILNPISVLVSALDGNSLYLLFRIADTLWLYTFCAPLPPPGPRRRRLAAKLKSTFQGAEPEPRAAA